MIDTFKRIVRLGEATRKIQEVMRTAAGAEA
jgi:hypothetical protein